MPTIAVAFIGVAVGVVGAGIFWAYGAWEYGKGFDAGFNCCHNYHKDKGCNCTQEVPGDE